MTFEAKLKPQVEKNINLKPIKKVNRYIYT